MLVKLSCCASTRRRWRSISLPMAWQTTLWRECSRTRPVLHVEKKRVESQKKCFLPLTWVFLRWCAWPTNILRTSNGRIHCWESHHRCCWWPKSRPPAPPPWWPCHLSSGPKGLLRPSPTHPEEPRGEMGPIFGVWDVGPGYITYVYSVIFWLYKN